MKAATTQKMTTTNNKSATVMPIRNPNELLLVAQSFGINDEALYYLFYTGQTITVNTVERYL